MSFDNFETNNTLRTALIFILLLYLTQPTKAQNLFFGGSYAKGASFGNVGKDNFEGIEYCCPKYDGYNATGYSAGLMSGYAVDPSFSAFIGLRFQERLFRFRKNETETIGLDNELVNGVFRHNLDFSVSAAVAEIGLQYNLNYWQFGVLYSSEIPIEARYKQYEKIVSPIDRGVFLDTKTRVRNSISDDFSGTNSLISGISVSFGYMLKLNKSETLFLKPNVELSAKLSDYMSNTGMSLFDVSGGVSFVYYPSGKPKRMDELFDGNAERNEKVSITLFQIESGVEKMLNPVIIETYQTDYLIAPSSPLLLSVLNPLSVSVSRKANAEIFRFYFYGSNFHKESSDLNLNLENLTNTNIKKVPLENQSVTNVPSDTLLALISSDNKLSYYLTIDSDLINSSFNISETFDLLFDVEKQYISNYRIVVENVSDESLIKMIQSIIASSPKAESFRIEANSEKTRQMLDKVEKHFVENRIKMQNKFINIVFDKANGNTTKILPPLETISVKVISGKR